jgi:phage gp45-like
MMNELYWRLQRLLGRGRGRVTSDDGPIQMVQVELNALETRDDIPNVQQFGFASYPPDGFLAIVSFLGGDRTSGAVVATSHQKYRFKLKPGEVAISDDKGQSIYLSAQGIRIEGADLPIEINGAPTVTVNGGDVIVSGGDVIANGISLENHVHTGVKAGPDKTGTPTT